MFVILCCEQYLIVYIHATVFTCQCPEGVQHQTGREQDVHWFIGNKITFHRLENGSSLGFFHTFWLLLFLLLNQSTLDPQLFIYIYKYLTQNESTLWLSHINWLRHHCQSNIQMCRTLAHCWSFCRALPKLAMTLWFGTDTETPNNTLFVGKLSHCHWTSFLILPWLSLQITSPGLLGVFADSYLFTLLHIFVELANIDNNYFIDPFGEIICTVAHIVHDGALLGFRRLSTLINVQ